MKAIKISLLFILSMFFINKVYCQYYHLKKDGNKYRLVNNKNKDLLNDKYDTIIKNKHFVKTVNGDLITIYRKRKLKKIRIRNLKQAYFKRDGLEVLTSSGPKYYDNNIIEIDNFPIINYFKCGTVSSKNYNLKFNKETKKYNLEYNEGYYDEEDTILELKGLPENIESLSFLDENSFTSVSVNNSYNTYPSLIRVTKNGKVGIYSYCFEEAIYPEKEKVKNEIAVSYEANSYSIDKITRDTIYTVVPVVIEPISLNTYGIIKLKEVLPIVYSSIQQNTYTGIVYLYKDKQIGVYPEHMNTSFDVFQQKSDLFYKIEKEGKQGWLDIKTFKEYYTE